MKKNILLFISVLLGLSAWQTALAVCPVCIVAVGACVGLSRWLGVDDFISGVWIGGLLISLTIWTVAWLDKKKIRFIFRKISVFVLWYGATLYGLYLSGIVGHPLNKIWGVDKIIFGAVLGTIVLFLAVGTHALLKKNHNGKSYFPYQKVAVPLLFLIITSLILHFIIGCSIKIPLI